MRILIITSTFAPDINGQSIFTTGLAQELAKSGHEIMVLVPGKPNSEPVLPAERIEIAHSPSIDLGLIYRGLVISGDSHLFLVRVFNSFQPEIVHLQDSAPICREAIKIARKRGIPVLGTHHPGPAVWAPYFSIKNQKLTEKIIVRLGWSWITSYLNRLDYITVPSAASVKMLLERGVNVPVKRISCGVDLGQFFPDKYLDKKEVRARYGLDSSKTTFLYVGRIDEEKAVELLINAFINVPRDDIQLAIAGRGPLEKRMVDLSSQSGMRGRIHFLGNIPRQDLPGLINAVDVFVMPSQVESFSISTIEAMACGKPVLGANAFALPELVEHDHNGRLYEPSQVDSLAEEMAWFASHPDRWLEMGEISRRRALGYKISTTVSSYQDLYREITVWAGQSPEQVPGSQPRHASSLPLWADYVLTNAWIPLLAGLLLFLLTASHRGQPDPLTIRDLPKIIVHEIRQILQGIVSKV